METRFLQILVCPVCKGELQREQDELLCKLDHLAFPIKDGVPIMLPEQARDTSAAPAK